MWKELDYVYIYNFCKIFVKNNNCKSNFKFVVLFQTYSGLQAIKLEAIFFGSVGVGFGCPNGLIRLNLRKMEKELFSES